MESEDKKEIGFLTFDEEGFAVMNGWTINRWKRI